MGVDVALLAKSGDLRDSTHDFSALTGDDTIASGSISKLDLKGNSAPLVEQSQATFLVLRDDFLAGLTDLLLWNWASLSWR